ncbi:unnamed protein product [Paramecium octaurelia]|uniref:Uncharacterized protein n=1 Tax=Paramecium octaurelia TaxID=43137 RepID=A0A8S1TAI8_PAROT|nr:unnamed protein product [Paramecium octaurelia]
MKREQMSKIRESNRFEYQQIFIMHFLVDSQWLDNEQFLKTKQNQCYYFKVGLIVRFNCIFEIGIQERILRRVGHGELRQKDYQQYKIILENEYK